MDYPLIPRFLLLPVLMLFAVVPAWAHRSLAAQPACQEIIVNGGFENPDGWTVGLDSIPPTTVNSPVYSGSQAMQLGLVEQPNQISNASIRQTVTIPEWAVTAELSFWVWLLSEPDPGSDRQELLLLAPSTAPDEAAPVIPWQSVANNPSWSEMRVNLGNVAGRTFDVLFNVFNDGLGGRTAMVIDAVSLTVCEAGALPPGFPTPEATTSQAPSTIPPLEASPTPPPVTIADVFNLTPPGDVIQDLSTREALRVYVDVRAPGVTDQPGQGPGILCWLYYSPLADWGTQWLTEIRLAMGYAGDVGEAGTADRYQAILGPLPASKFEYTARCSGDNGKTEVPANTANSGGNGKVQVVADFVSPTPSRPTPTAVTQTPGPTASPTSLPTLEPTWEPTAGPGPGGGACKDLIRNGGFERSEAWIPGHTAFPPTYVSAPTYPVKSGSRSMRLGIDSSAVTPEESYSSIRQPVAIPPGTERVEIVFWYYPLSQDATGSGDRQELILLDPETGATLQVLWRTLENRSTWTQQQIDITTYRGRNVVVYFNVLNDANGKPTAMYLDDVMLLACESSHGPMPPRPPYPGMPGPPQPKPPFPPTVTPPFPPTITPTFTPASPPFIPVGPTHISVDVGALATALAVTPGARLTSPPQPEISGTPEPEQTETATPSRPTEEAPDVEDGGILPDRLNATALVTICGIALLIVLAFALIMRLFGGS